MATFYLYFVLFLFYQQSSTYMYLVKALNFFTNSRIGTPLASVYGALNETRCFKFCQNYVIKINWKNVFQFYNYSQNYCWLKKLCTILKYYTTQCPNACFLSFCTITQRKCDSPFKTVPNFLLSLNRVWYRKKADYNFLCPEREIQMKTKNKHLSCH